MGDIYTSILYPPSMVAAVCLYLVLTSEWYRLLEYTTEYSLGNYDIIANDVVFETFRMKKDDIDDVSPCEESWKLSESYPGECKQTFSSFNDVVTAESVDLNVELTRHCYRHIQWLLQGYDFTDYFNNMFESRSVKDCDIWNAIDRYCITNKCSTVMDECNNNDQLLPCNCITTGNCALSTQSF